MIRPGYRAGLIFCGIVLTGACSRPEMPRPPRVTVAPISVPTPVPSLTRDGAEFVAISGSIDLFVIRSSELALQRSRSRGVRDFAAAEINAHRGTAAQLSLAGRRLNLLPTAILRPVEQQMLDTLGRTPDFDATYVRQQRMVHQHALALCRNYAVNGQSATLRTVASAAAPILQRHLGLLLYL